MAEPAPSSVSFPPFRLDLENAQLWRGNVVIPLRPKSFTLLHYLAERSGRLVTKDELLDAGWPKTVVSDIALKVCIRELRKALDDTARPAQIIETVHRRGYRFLPAVTTSQPLTSKTATEPNSQQLATDAGQLTTRLLGREAELAQLCARLTKAKNGQRQVVFVTGEAGIGKTTLLEAFLSMSQDPSLWIAQGQCIEHYGPGEAFLPVLEGFGRLCRQPHGGRLISLLREHAPSWLLQLPGLISSAAREALQREYAGVSRDRMLRELVVGLEAVTEKTPLIVILEDLHWSDSSTIDLLSALARRRHPARLLVIGTYRPSDALESGHPLARIIPELRLRQYCDELPLTYLSEPAVAAYLATRFAGLQPCAPLAALIHKQTDGNPLFMINAADHLVTQGFLTATDGQWALRVALEEIERAVPHTLRQLIQLQLDRLSPVELQVLEAASVAGVEFAAQALATEVEESPQLVDAQCAGLAQRQQFLRQMGSDVWPDGTEVTHYEFIHALYQDILYQNIPDARRAYLHQRIGARLEEAYGAGAAEIAAQLAMHFERGREIVRAVHYRQRAGENAVQRYAYQEAIAHLSKGLALLETFPDTPERDQQELALQVTLGVPLLNTKGFTAPEVERAHSRALALCRRIGETPQLFRVLEGLHTFYAVRGDLPIAYDLAQQLLRLGQRVQDPLMRVEGHHTVGTMELRRANLSLARSHLEQAVALYDPRYSVEAISYSGHDPRVCCLGYLGVALWYSGFPDQSLHRANEGLVFAQQLAHPYSIALAQVNLAWVLMLRGDSQRAEALAEATVALARKQGYPFYIALGAMFRGWARTSLGYSQDGEEQLRQGFAICEAIGMGRLEYLLMFAAACASSRRPREGLNALTEAAKIIHQTEERYLEVELHRLRGELFLQALSLGNQWSGEQNLESAAETAFHTAVTLAQQQQAKTLELRAVTSLSRLWQRQGKPTQAEELLRDAYGWFTEGFDTADLQRAAALLEDLSR